MELSLTKQPQTEKAKSISLWEDAARRLLRNKAAVVGLVFIVVLTFASIFAGKLVSHTYDLQSLKDQNNIPAWLSVIFPGMTRYVHISSEYVLGADTLGRDILSRILYGGRVSLTIALFAPLLSLLIGVTYGSISGYGGEKLDTIMMRIVDVFYAFPSLLFIILLMTLFKGASHAQAGTITYFIGRFDEKLNGILFIFVGIGLTSWQTIARLTRSQVLAAREREYVDAARTIGATNYRIITKHILPNIIGPLIVAETLAIPQYIATETFLSFIGIGVNPPMPSWGLMISDGAKVLQTYPNQSLFPALVLALTMFAFNFLGDGLRDALDPRLRGTQ